MLLLNPLNLALKNLCHRFCLRYIRIRLERERLSKQFYSDEFFQRRTKPPLSSLYRPGHRLCLQQFVKLGKQTVDF